MKNIMKNNQIRLIGFVTTMVAVFVVSFFAFSQIALATGYICNDGDTLTASEARIALSRNQISINYKKVNNNSASVTIKNDTGCKLPAAVKSFKVYDNTGGQTLFSESEIEFIPAYSSYKFTSALAPCLTQVDTFYRNTFSGSGVIIGTDGQIFNTISSARGLFCTDTPPPTIPNLVGSCSVSSSDAYIGDPVTWSANASGGTGSYTYSWTGDNPIGVGNASASGKNVGVVYRTVGEKTGTVTITSGAQTVTKTCHITINQRQNQGLTASCSVNPSTVKIGNSVNWSVSASGGTGSYTYSWTGTDGLSGNSSSLSKTYSSIGSKVGTVIVTSGSESVTRTCNAVVSEDPIIIPDHLSVSCDVDDSSINIDEDVTWRAVVSGGNGNYNYEWDGTDGLHSHNRTVSWSYDDNGTKRATITVTSNGETASDTCSTKVRDEEDYDNLKVSCYASPDNTAIGNQVRWYAEVDGGDGNYDYTWTGSESLSSSSKSPRMTYDNPGKKKATLTVRDGDGNKDSDTCYVNVNSVLAFSQEYQGPVAEAVYLSQVPYTGVADNHKLAIFVGILSLFSAWIAYIIVARKSQLEV